MRSLDAHFDAPPRQPRSPRGAKSRAGARIDMAFSTPARRTAGGAALRSVLAGGERLPSAGGGCGDSPRGAKQAAEQLDADLKLASEASAERHAFEALVRRYQRDVYGIALSVLGDPDLAWDAAQECFLKLYRRLATYRGEAPLKAWLSRVALHVALDLRRGRLRIPEVGLEDRALCSLPDDAHRPDERAALSEDGRRLGEAWSSLGEMHQAILSLRELEGLSYAEIAQALEIPVGTVMSRLFYARRTLRERMEGLELPLAA